MTSAMVAEKGGAAARIPLRDGEAQLRKQACLNRIRPSPAPASKLARALLPARNDIGNAPRLTPPRYRRLHLGQFEIGKPLGKGKFGRVYLARHRESGYICALKVLNKDEITREGGEMHVRREIEVHSNLRHPGVLGFHGWFHDAHRIFLILEYAAGGELYRVLQKEGRFSERRAAKYIAQVTLSLIYLHGKNVMHRDMKPENILLGLHDELKLADFGYSVHAPSNFRSTLCGTLDYLPPEMLQPGNPGYTNAVDQWTLGILTYEFLAGEAPFEDTVAKTRIRIAKGEMKPLPAYISREAKHFVHSLLVLDPEKRLPLKDVLDHPWIVKHNKSAA
ncbi:serine/threonine-protein kinase [Nemania sp. FL0916]|nr:serine/threonine-protein kinase [Nemania sp. FL0916]